MGNKSQKSLIQSYLKKGDKFFEKKLSKISLNLKTKKNKQDIIFFVIILISQAHRMPRGP